MREPVKLCDTAVQILSDHLQNREREAHSLLSLCESPAEQIFLAASFEYFGLVFNEHFKRGQAAFGAGHPLADGIFTLLVEPQKVIECYGASYRVDFLFTLYRFNSGGKPRLWGNTIVEIDGHDFHEKTKVQASRDKKRDRDLLAEGYVTMRYSGSDVFNGPMQCVEEVFFRLDHSASETVKSFEDRGALSELLWGG